MRILVTGSIDWSDNWLKTIKKLGHEIIYIQDEQIPLIQQNINCSEIEGVICNGLFLNNDIKKFKNLKFIQLTSVGYDRVPIEYIKKNNIKIFNAKDVYCVPIAEFVVCSILSMYKRIYYFYNNKSKKIWKKNRELYELFGKKICIIGCGNIGKECAKRLDAFGCEITGIDIYTFKNKYFNEIKEMTEIENEISKSDIIILALPLTKNTRHIISKDVLSKMKKNSLLVNISRGEIIKTEDLINVLNEKKILGAILDVFEEEPLPKENPLWDMENVIITPHNSFIGENNKKRLFNLILENLRCI